MTKHKVIGLLSLMAVFLLSAMSISLAQVELRITWYNDGNEGQVPRNLLDRFEAENPDIDVVVDTVPYASGILQALPLQLASSEGPDLARVTDLGGLSEYFLDLRPYLENPAYWEENFGPFLDWMRPEGSNAIPGFMTQLTVTGPFVNKTLFDQAGIPLPEGETTWQEWAEVTRKVAQATGTPFAMGLDRSGHRLAGPAISMGANYFDEEGDPIVTDEGFRRMAELMLKWHQNGTMMPDIWIGSGGSYAAGNEEFINAQFPFYMSGSWQIGQFANTIGTAFDWVAVPNPCGPAACTSMPGGAALVAFENTEHPKAVAKLMEYLASEEVLGNSMRAHCLFPAILVWRSKALITPPITSSPPTPSRSLPTRSPNWPRWRTGPRVIPTTELSLMSAVTV